MKNDDDNNDDGNNDDAYDVGDYASHAFYRDPHSRGLRQEGPIKARFKQARVLPHRRLRHENPDCL